MREEKTYKILGITSGRPMGNAEVLLRECLMECEKLASVDVRITRLRTLKIEECDGCMECMKSAAEGRNGNCVKQDEFEWLKEQILWADAIVFADPCFTYMCTSEVITLMNRAMGIGRDYRKECRNAQKLVGLICVGGSDTVDYTLPTMYQSLHAMCPGFELVDQFYANWVRGKGHVVYQEHHLERARTQAKRMIHRLQGYAVPRNNTRIMKLNPLEHKDDIFRELEECPVCRSSAVHMKTNVQANGKFTCAVCGATGHVEYHGGELSYVWEDETVAHNLLHEEQEQIYIDDFAKAHMPVDAAEKQTVADFQIITPADDPGVEKSRILAVVIGPKGGTSELLAKKALEEATRDGKHEGVIVRLNDLNIHFCTGCLLCKVNKRYRGGIDECILKDDFLWMVDKFLESDGVIFSLDAINGFTYGQLLNLQERFGHFEKTKSPTNRPPRACAVMISAFDKQVDNATYPVNFTSDFFCNHGPMVAQEYFVNVPIVGDDILANKKALGKAGRVGTILANAVTKIVNDPSMMPLVRKVEGVCPSCGLSMIQLHPDRSVSCILCDSEGKLEHRFGENVIVWDDYSVKHSRRTFAGAMLHAEHIGFSQAEDDAVLKNAKLIQEDLNPYIEYGKLVKPER